MKKNIFTLFFITTLFSSQISWACDLLRIDIGSNKSSIENIFGTFEDEQSQLEEIIGTTRGTGSIGLAGEVFIYFTEKRAFCEDIDFGDVLIKGYVVNNKVGAVEIEVQNGKDNDQSKKGLLKQYVQANFGTVDTEDKSWPGYKFWNIGGKQIFYYKIIDKNNEISEGVAVTSPKYYDVLLEDED